MTKKQWLKSQDPLAMLHWLINSGIGARKLRLFACSCVRMIGERGGIKFGRVIELGEQIADGIAAPQEVEQERARILRTSKQGLALPLWNDIEKSFLSIFSHDFCLWDREGYIPLIHDIFGNPFRPITIDPRWLTSTVVDLANTIYQEIAFDRMPLLADALMDAGCDNQEIISHCRSEGVHVRGCWALDLLLDKK